MAEPRRLLDDPETSPFARDLLASAANDGPSADNRAAAARRLGIAALTLAGGGKATTAIAGALWWKAGLVIALLGGIIGIAVVVGSIDLAGSAASDRAKLALPAEPVVPAPAPAPAPAVVAEPAPVAPAPGPEIAAVPEPAPAVKPARKVRPIETPAPAPVEPAPVIEEPAPAPPAPAPPAPAPIDARRLAAEVAVLDRARAALKARDPAAALVVLDEHRREFADGALVAEAEVVRLEALIQAGRTADARDHARSFLQRFPSSPLVRRVRSLVQRLEESP